MHVHATQHSDPSIELDGGCRVRRTTYVARVLARFRIARTGVVDLRPPCAASSSLPVLLRNAPTLARQPTLTARPVRAACSIAAITRTNLVRVFPTESSSSLRGAGRESLCAIRALGASRGSGAARTATRPPTGHSTWFVEQACSAVQIRHRSQPRLRVHRRPSAVARLTRTGRILAS